jgi:hypothetical protein
MGCTLIFDHPQALLEIINGRVKRAGPTGRRLWELDRNSPPTSIRRLHLDKAEQINREIFRIFLCEIIAND